VRFPHQVVFSVLTMLLVKCSLGPHIKILNSSQSISRTAMRSRLRDEIYMEELGPKHVR